MPMHENSTLKFPAPQCPGFIPEVEIEPEIIGETQDDATGEVVKIIEFPQTEHSQGFVCSVPGNEKVQFAFGGQPVTVESGAKNCLPVVGLSINGLSVPTKGGLELAQLCNMPWNSFVRDLTIPAGVRENQSSAGDLTQTEPTMPSQETQETHSAAGRGEDEMSEEQCDGSVEPVKAFRVETKKDSRKVVLYRLKGVLDVNLMQKFLTVPECELLKLLYDDSALENATVESKVGKLALRIQKRLASVKGIPLSNVGTIKPLNLEGGAPRLMDGDAVERKGYSRQYRQYIFLESADGGGGDVEIVSACVRIPPEAGLAVSWALADSRKVILNPPNQGYLKVLLVDC